MANYFDYFNQLVTWPIILIILIKLYCHLIKCNYVEMDQSSAIKWSIIEKAKFGLHSLNADKKKLSYSSTAWYYVLPPQEDRWSRAM